MTTPPSPSMRNSGPSTESGSPDVPMPAELGRPDEEPPGIRRIRAVLQWTSKHDFAVGCPLWTTLSLEASRRDQIAAVLLDAPTSQQRGSLLLAAVHDLVLAGVDHPLRDYFPTVDPDHRQIDNRLASVFNEFTGRFDHELRAIVRTRTVQTNEVGRASAVRVAVAALGSELGVANIDVVEIGAAAGLLLGFDNYGCRIGETEFATRTAAASTLMLEPLLLDGAVPASWLASAPVVRHRVGLDLDPLDLDDPADRRWLHACVWPSQLDRHDQLDRAIDIAPASNITMTSGDAVDIERHVRALPPGATTVVLSSWTLAYLSEDDRIAVFERLRELSRERTLGMVCIEGDGIVPGLDSSIEIAGRLPLVISITTFINGERSDRVIGSVGGQGDWISLLAA